MKKCLDWIEKSRPYFGSHKTDEEYESALLMTKCALETEHDSVSGMSGGKCIKISLPRRFSETIFKRMRYPKDFFSS